MKALLFSLGLLIASTDAGHIDQRAQQCPTSLDNADFAPNAVVSVSAKDPQRAFGASSTAKVTPNDMCTWFSIDAPPQSSSVKCTLSFALPAKGYSRSGYDISGTGNFQMRAFYYTSGDVQLSSSTTWNTQPRNRGDVRDYTVRINPDTLVAVAEGPCNPSPITSRLYIRLCSTDSTLVFNQEADQCPTGVYLLHEGRRAPLIPSSSVPAPVAPAPSTIIITTTTVVTSRTIITLSPTTTTYSGGVGLLPKLP